MVKRKAKSRSKKRGIQLKRRPKKRKIHQKVPRSRSYLDSSGWGGFLDTTVSVRSLLKCSGITLAFVVILVSVFMLGRASAGADEGMGSSESSMQLSGQTKKVEKVDDGAGVTGVSREEAGEAELQEEEIDVPEEEEFPEEANLSESEGSAYTPVGGYSVVDNDIPDGGEDGGDSHILPDCDGLDVAGFDYAYTKIGIGVSNFQRELRGDNWASLSSLKLTITNNEPCTIVNPTRIKIKMNEVGKGSVWWDDDVFLPDEFMNMAPGKSVSAVIPVHVSYSDIYSEKDFKLALFDDYDIHMATFKERLTFP